MSEVPTIPSGLHMGKTVDAVWAEDAQYVWFLSQRHLTLAQQLRYKAFFESCPGAVQRAQELTEGLSPPEARQHQMPGQQMPGLPSNAFQPNGWRGW